MGIIIHMKASVVANLLILISRLEEERDVEDPAGRNHRHSFHSLTFSIRKGGMNLPAASVPSFLSRGSLHSSNPVSMD